MFASIEAQEINSFAKAKKALIGFYTQHPQYQSDFYCNAPFKKAENHFEVMPSRFYKSRKQTNKAKVIEWEHIMPSYNFGRHLPCWKNGGRSACQKDSTFKKMEADLQNLVPAIDEINRDRSNFRYAQAQKICALYNMVIAMFLLILRLSVFILRIILRVGLRGVIFI